VKFWLDRISTAKRWRDRKGDEFRWETFIKEYKGTYDVTLGTRNSRVQVPAINDVFAYVQSDVSAMYFRDPYFTVNATKAATVRGAAILETALNYYWRHLDCKTEIESQMIESDLVGHGWNKDGYFAESAGDEEPARIANEGMYSMRVSWRDVVFNIGARNPPKDCLWMAHRLIKPLDEVKKKYRGVGDLKGSIHPHLTESDYKQTVYKDDIEVVVLWEVWDATVRQKFLIAEGHDGYLEKPRAWPDYYKRFPFNMLWYYEMPDEPYPMSAIAPWEAQILETNKLFAQAMNHVKRWNRQAFIKGGALTPEQMDSFEEGIDGAIHEVAGQGSVQEIVKFADFGQLPTDIYALLDRLAQIKREVNGQPEFVRGAMLKTNTRTLGELEQISQGAGARSDKRVDRLETHLETIAQNLIAHMQANFDVEKMVKITGETPEAVIEALGDNYDPVLRTVTFAPEDIMGEYDVTIKAGSTLPMTKQARMAILREVLELAAKMNGPVPNFVKVIILDLLRDYQLPALKQAFEQDQSQMEKQAGEEKSMAEFQKAKVAADTMKREEQANQLGLENAQLEAQLNTPLSVLNAANGGEQDAL
jgi:hypothetical protein